MQFRLLIIGAFIHCIFVIWCYDMFDKRIGSNIACPLLSLDTDDDGNYNYPRRLLIYAVLRDRSSKGPISGMGNDFSRHITNVIYFGESSVPKYYENSDSWMKFSYEQNWDNFKEDFNIVLESFHEKITDLRTSNCLLFLVFHGINNERNTLFLWDRLENERRFLDKLYGENSTNVLYFIETTRILHSSGYRVKHTESKMIRNADLLPLISTVLNVDVPYDSFALVPENFLESTADLAVAKYCNIVNLKHIVKVARQNTGIMKFLKNKLQKNSIAALDNSIRDMLLIKNYTCALMLTQNAIAYHISAYIYSKQILNTMLLILIVISTICWLILLGFEYINLSAAVFIAQCKRYLFHLIFLVISIALVSVPFSLGWPFTYHLYLQLPLCLLWLTIIKMKSLLAIKFNLDDINQFLKFSFAVLFSVEYLLIDENIILSLSICLVALFPSLPKFRSVPFLFIFVWYLLSALLLGLTNVNLFEDLEPGIKYVNFTGTIWLLISGIALLWMRPKFDKILIGFFTACIGLSLWLQNICLALKYNCSILFYCSWPLFTVILLPIFGKTDAIRKLVQCVLALIIPVMLTSTKLEPASLLVLIVYMASWSSIEKQNNHTNMDNLRRMIIIVYVLNLTNQLTASDHLSLRCLLCNIYNNIEIYIFLITLLRLTFIYTSILTTFTLVLGSKLEAYRSAILVAVVLTMASLRTLIPLARFSFDTIEFQHHLERYVHINTMAIVFIVSHTISMIYARHYKHDVTEFLPPLQQAAI